MNKQAIVGLFTLLGLAALFAVFLFIQNIGTGGRYQIGVHFKSAAGLHKGALVYQSGVIVGVVDSTQLLPQDFTVEVVLSINNAVDVARDSRFVISVPFTGDSSLEIVPPALPARASAVVGPTPPPPAVALLPRQVLPIEQQPQGETPASISDLLAEGQNQVHRLDSMLAELAAAEPRLLTTLQSALDNANQLTSQGNKRLFALTDKLDAMTSSLQLAAEAGGKNIVDMTGVLDATTRRNAGNVDQMLRMLRQASVALNQTVDQVRDLAANPQVHQNLLDTTKGLATTATTIGAMTQDLRQITGDPQTQAQLRDTVANTDAATQKLNSLLRSLGGTSSVYGVDAGATPAPGTRPGSAVPLQRGAIPNAAASPTVATLPENFKSRIGAVARNLIAIQLRLSELDDDNPASSSAPALQTSRRGPQSDLNAILLPAGKTSLFAGANDIGTPQTSWNLAVKEHVAPHLSIGGGVLYNNLGFMAQYDPGVLGVETRIYDPAFPTLDAYGNLNVAHGVSLFGGERDILHSGRRTVFGLQLQF